MQRGREFSIMLGQTELMNSRSTGSEKALAALACKRIGPNERPEVLIGGLGMGFTLRAALSELGASARIVVAELVPAVVRWARGPLAELFGSSLADPRVTLHEADVSRVMKRSKSAYAAIRLDVDNGPEGLTRESNERLYDVRGLMAARAALRPGGVLAVSDHALMPCHAVCSPSCSRSASGAWRGATEILIVLVSRFSFLCENRHSPGARLVLRRERAVEPDTIPLIEDHQPLRKHAVSSATLTGSRR
jgi:spermidine synthase